LYHMCGVRRHWKNLIGEGYTEMQRGAAVTATPLLEIWVFR
jgi:hypothetical protein